MTNSPSVKRIGLRSLSDSRGVLTFAEVSQDIPFPISRLFLLTDLMKDTRRGDHANLDEQVLIVPVGRLRVLTNDGASEEDHELGSPALGLYLGTMVWRTLLPLMDGTVCVVASSLPYRDDNYIREFTEFTRLAKAQNA